jgi:hypothetical protein
LTIKDIVEYFRKGVKNDDNLLQDLSNQVYSKCSYDNLKLLEGNFVSLTEIVIKLGGMNRHVRVEERTNSGRVDMVIHLQDIIYNRW